MPADFLMTAGSHEINAVSERCEFRSRWEVFSYGIHRVIVLLTSFLNLMLPAVHPVAMKSSW